MLEDVAYISRQVKVVVTQSVQGTTQVASFLKHFKRLILFLTPVVNFFVLSKCSIDLGRLSEKVRFVAFEIRSKWRPSAGARYARARQNATCKFNSVFIQIILKSL